MKPILQINQAKSSDENMLSFKVTVIQGAEIINTEEDLHIHLDKTYPYNKGIVEIIRISNDVWEVRTRK